MAFKRYAALLAGSALAGSALFAQPAMAEEAAEFSYAPVTVEKGQTAESAAPAGADDCARILPVSTSSENLKLVEELGADVDKESGVVSFDQTELDTAPEAEAYTLNIACAIEKEGETTEWKTTLLEVTVEEKALTFADTTAKQGATVTVTKSSAPAEFENLTSTTEGFTLTTEDDDTVKLTVGAAVTEGEYTVDFTYEAYGDDEAKKGSFKVTVKAETDEDEDKDEPKENASSKASSNFRGSFKGLSSK